MSVSTSLILAGCLAWSLCACSSGPPLPVLPDGLHREPINRLPPAPDAPRVPAERESLDAGDRS
ncbi:hypothetical protein [Burkholderia sp. Ac-20353]|uniref:hypothetical protein n=1 Tax=Burkholderia sp. Ac-20353 TaxID=2703894 RepID=UPI00197C795A|nr:hypothetical protein [Burkholderia sp. Ac-20353]MBN3787514.1 hypothetical protein [Burkholderia sp. Ac-20353]